MSFFNFRDKDGCNRKKKLFLLFSAILVVMSIGSLAMHGLNLGLDFKEHNM
jgi:preprotein translocase subunit SecF